MTAASLYDLFYPSIRGVTYEAEAEYFHGLIQSNLPKAKTILDVACGTGGHAASLSRFYKISGVDCNKSWLSRARVRTPNAVFYDGKMCSFNLTKTFDVLLCLGCSIGYTKTIDELYKTLANFRKHMEKNGLLVLEPWLAPEEWESGKMDVHTFRTTSLNITRMTHYGMDNDFSKLTHDYIIERQSGTERVKEQHVLGLFTPEDLKAGLQQADFGNIRVETFMPGRKLFIAKAE
ncbi:MAG: class I SAM-dependent methyltransferase [Calditrichia bacterium]